MSAENHQRCCATMRGRFIWNAQQCSKRGTVERDGAWYCGTHDPVRIKERNHAKVEKWRAQNERERQERDRFAAEAAETKRRAECYPGLVEALRRICLADVTVMCATTAGKAELEAGLLQGLSALRAAGEIE